MMKKFKNRHIVLIAALVLAISVVIVACQNTSEGSVSSSEGSVSSSEGSASFENTGTTCGNIVMGDGIFAYRDGFVYVSTGGRIIEYDLESGVSVFLELPSSYAYGARNIFLSESDIYYTGSGSLNTIRRDGKKNGTVFERTDLSCLKFFVDGAEAYFMNAVEGSLFRMDMQTMKETELISRVNSYYADEAKLYVVARDAAGQWVLFCSSRDEIDFEQIELSFQPIAVYADEQGIFLTQQGSSWQIVRYADGTETRLPCYGMLYQVLGDSLIYLEKQPGTTGTSPLKSYNLTTEEETLLHESVYNFCILEERYIACDLGGVTGGYILIDTQTGETIEIYNDESSTEEVK